jgi:hypothetical protein
MHGRIRERGARRLAGAIVLVCAPVAFGCVAVYAPSWVTIGIAVAAACAWSAWLERLDHRSKSPPAQRPHS